MTRRSTTLPKKGIGARSPIRARRTSWTWIGGGLMALILIVGGLWMTSRRPAQTLPGQHFPIQGQQHILPGEVHPPYNSDPPTSGWHFDTPLASGFHEKAAPDEQVVHNLEHGHVVISYDCTKLADCAETQTRIRQLMERYRNWKVTALPRQNISAAVALTAWGWLEELDGYDEERITNFISAWRDRGPERTQE